MKIIKKKNLKKDIVQLFTNIKLNNKLKLNFFYFIVVLLHIIAAYLKILYN